MCGVVCVHRCVRACVCVCVCVNGDSGVYRPMPVRFLHEQAVCVLLLCKINHFVFSSFCLACCRERNHPSSESLLS